MTSSIQQAREALGARLRELRRRAGITGRDLARREGWHESKVSKIEYGRVKPSDADVRAYCRHTGAADQLDDLLASVHNLDAAYLEYRRQHVAGLRQGQRRSIKRAEQADIVRIFQPHVIPGIVQTAEYAEAILRHAVAFYRLPDDVDEAVAARIERQQLLYRGHRRFHILVAEQALHNTVGDDAVMAGQLDRLLAVLGLPRVRIGILPADAELPMQVTNFVMFDDQLVQVEALTAELSITQPREIAVYGRAFDLIAGHAVYGADARELIAGQAERRGGGSRCD
ncbi:helix-turn-helix domain-containing protein [Nocardia cyriacigeorgica]|uniref:Helix-turn-helix domain-containing protein n=1 Tax=Nocardia cyriacigeorgica TaxID=135487 RepID=A0A5R8NC64_9NOCA|nr:helix-turn-helix transcriptional regulator [Nocardia cyriacigeorgica]TLF73234.1 helix-turn-helix domain-containing protein [Nocardia cyriacigeorgica]